MKKVFLATVLAGGLLSPNLSHAEAKSNSWWDNVRSHVHAIIGPILDQHKKHLDHAIDLSKKHVADGHEAINQPGHPLAVIHKKLDESLAETHKKLDESHAKIKEALIKFHHEAVDAHQKGAGSL